MPDAKEFASNLQKFHDFSVFPHINRSLIDKLDSLVEKDIPFIVSEADVVSSNALSGLSSKPERQLEVKDVPVVTEEEKTKGNTPKKVKGSVFRVLGRMITFLIFLASSVEGVYYLSYGSPAYSLSELQSGYTELLSSAPQLPEVTEMIKSKLTSLIAKDKIEEMESRTSVENPSDTDDGKDSEL